MWYWRKPPYPWVEILSLKTSNILFQWLQAKVYETLVYTFLFGLAAWPQLDSCIKDSQLPIQGRTMEGSCSERNQ